MEVLTGIKVVLKQQEKILTSKQMLYLSHISREFLTVGELLKWCNIQNSKLHKSKMCEAEIVEEN